MSIIIVIYIYLFIQYIWSVFFMNCDNKRKNHGYITSITICILSIMEVYGDIVYIYIYMVNINYSLLSQIDGVWSIYT